MTPSGWDGDGDQGAVAGVEQGAAGAGRAARCCRGAGGRRSGRPRGGSEGRSGSRAWRAAPRPASRLNPLARVSGSPARTRAGPPGAPGDDLAELRAGLAVGEQVRVVDHDGARTGDGRTAPRRARRRRGRTARRQRRRRAAPARERSGEGRGVTRMTWAPPASSDRVMASRIGGAPGLGRAGDDERRASRRTGRGRGRSARRRRRRPGPTAGRSPGGPQPPGLVEGDPGRQHVDPERPPRAAAPRRPGRRPSRRSGAARRPGPGPEASGASSATWVSMPVPARNARPGGMSSGRSRGRSPARA